MDGQKTDNELIEQYLVTQDPALREEVILRCVPLVHFVLGRLGVTHWTGIDYDDLVSQGLLGVIESVDRFDPSYGTRLSTFATFKIRGKVLDYLRGLDWLPRAARQRVRQVQEAIEVLEAQLRRLPTDEELAKFLNMEMETLQQTLLDSSRMVISLDEEQDLEGEGNISLHERIIDEQQEDPSLLVENGELQGKLVDAIKELPERDQKVLSLYYFDELTFKEIGMVLGVSESRICQIHGRAVIALKALISDARQERHVKSIPVERMESTTKSAALP